MARIPVIKLVNVAKEFELGKVKVQALASVNLEIYSGEFIIFFGPSGCGKSTMMSMIAGLQPPTTGKILIRGEDIAKLNENQLSSHRRGKIGMVFQTFNLISAMNVVENIALPLAFSRIPKRRRMARAENLLEVVGMNEYKKHTPAELSGGQQQKIAIARSLVANPWIVLADEPTGNLDSKSANEVMRLLISLNRKSKRTVVLITHNPDYLEYADRIFYLRDGKVVDVKVNPRVKKVEGVSSVGKIKTEVTSDGKESEAYDVEETFEEKGTKAKKGRKPKKGKEKPQKTEEAVEPVEPVAETEELTGEAQGQEEEGTLEAPADIAGDVMAEKTDEAEEKKEQKGGLGPIKLGK